MLSSGSIFQLYEKYMEPREVETGGISPIELMRIAQETTFCRLLPCAMEDFSGIAVSGGSVIFPLISFLEADGIYDAVCQAAADVLMTTTSLPLATGPSIFDAISIDSPILRLAKIELIFVNGPGAIMRPGRYIIYADSRYYAAQFESGGRFLSVASYPYVYWVSDIDFISSLFAARSKPSILEIKDRM